MHPAEIVLNNLLETIQRNAVDNKSEITNVQMFVQSWKEEMEIEQSQVSKVIELWEVRFRDIDPDTGYTSQDKALYIAFSKVDAERLANLLATDYMENVSDPNREFFARKKKLLF
jgi:hypothetical protein